MSKTIEQIRQELDAKIPRDAVSLRDGGGGRKLSYLEGHYVIARMNQVFGQGNWEYRLLSLNLVHQGEIESYGKQSYTAHYIATVLLRARLGDAWTEFSDVGYGDGTDKVNQGKSHELAVKEAVTDAVKRCAKNLGMSMGLALYSKTQENVDDGEEANDSGKAAIKQPANRAANSGRVISNAPRSVENANGGASGNAAKEQGAKEKSVSEALTLISSMSRVVVAKKKASVEDLLKYMQSTFKVENKEQLTGEQANQMLSYLKNLAGA